MLSNNATFSAYELSVLFGSENLINFEENFNSVGVVIDTRILTSGNIFIPLKGENTDGYNFIEKALEKGASAILVENEQKENVLNQFQNICMIVTDDNLEALGKLASYHRRRFDFPVIAIGGSNGKTTTKEMVASLLSENYKVLKTYGNFNNKIGLPLMMLQFSKDFNMAVLEVGTNTPGEIYDLSKILKPTHALITNIGKEHLEFLIDLDGVELEETYLFSEVRSTGFAFVNYDDERLKKYGHILGKFITYGTDENARFRCEYCLNDFLNPQIKIISSNENDSIQMQTTGYASALNAIAALSVAEHFEIPFNKMKNSLENFKPLESSLGYGRMAVTNIKSVVIINDTYNSNPDSAIAALKNLDLIKSNGKKIAVLGDMRELGESSFNEHKTVLEFALNTADFVLLTGLEFQITSKHFTSEKLFKFESKEKLIKYLYQIISQGDVVLVKGSRGLKMEVIVNELKDFLQKG